MSASEAAAAAARLRAEFGDAASAERAAGARIQAACNATERRFWGDVRRLLTAADEGGVAESRDAPTRPDVHR